MEILTPEQLAELANEEPVVAPAYAGIGRKYIDSVVALRAKNWTFTAITEWMANHGVVLSAHGWRSAYDVHTGKRSHAQKK